MSEPQMATGAEGARSEKSLVPGPRKTGFESFQSV